MLFFFPVLFPLLQKQRMKKKKFIIYDRGGMFEIPNQFINSLNIDLIFIIKKNYKYLGVPKKKKRTVETLYLLTFWPPSAFDRFLNNILEFSFRSIHVTTHRITTLSINFKYYRYFQFYYKIIGQTEIPWLRYTTDKSIIRE